MKVRVWLTLLVFTVIATNQVARGGDVASSVQQIKQAPALDGKGDDAVWRNARAESLKPNEPLQGNAVQTEFRVLADQKNLYFLVECAAVDTNRLQRLQKKENDKIDWAEEVLEIFFRPNLDAPEYYHLAIDPAGTRYDNVGLLGATDYNFEWTVATHVENGKWTAEFSIPMASVGLPNGLESGQQIGFNIGRQTASPKQLYGWSITSSFHRPDAFGRLVIGSFQNAARMKVTQFEKDYQALARQMNDDGNARGAVAALTAKLRGDADTVSDAASWFQFIRQYDDAQLSSRIALAGGTPLATWLCSPWELPARHDIPLGNASVDVIDVSGFQGEYLTAAAALGNLSRDVMEVRCVDSPLRLVNGSHTAESTSALTVRQVQHLKLQGDVIQRDPLPRFRQENVLRIQPGTNDILWLTVDTSGLQPGTWEADIAVKSVMDRNVSHAFKLVVRVYPTGSVKVDGPLAYVWPTLDGLPARDLEAVASDMVAHGVNMHKVRAIDCGLFNLQFDDQGSLQGEPDFSQIGKIIDRMGVDGQFYVVVIDYPRLPAEMQGTGLEAEPDLKERNLAAYAAKLRSYFEQRGVGVEQYAWYVVDEPDETKAKAAEKLARMLMRNDPEQQIFATAYNGTPIEAVEILAPYVNVWVIKASGREQRAYVKSHGRKGYRQFSYNVMSRLTQPMQYRREILRAWADGDESVGFWSYDDAGGDAASTWDDFDGRGRTDYAVVYDGTDAPIPSVRWEAWRQGVQDYRRLQMLEVLSDQSGSSTNLKSLLDQKAIGGLLPRNGTEVTAYFDRVRDVVIEQLVTRKEIEAGTVEEIRRPLPVCLTGNDGVVPTGSPVKASYRMNSGADLPGAMAKLLDGSIQYPASWLIVPVIPAEWEITFDLGSPLLLNHALLYIDSFPGAKNYKGVRSEVSMTGSPGDWESTANIDMVPITDVKLASDNSLSVPLSGKRARYVRFTFITWQETSRLGEVKIFGWPDE